MIGTNMTSSSSWSWNQDKQFERALIMFPDESPERWDNIAAQVPGKSAMDVRKHFEDLEHDVMEIESGRVELPRYEGESESAGWENESGRSQFWFGPKGKEKENERRKGVPWTEEEHKLFLIGLQKYGKGDWRSISRNAVVSRTPTQVASHAQKYFLRLNSISKKDKKRSSIHDITMADDGPSSIGQGNYQNGFGTTVADNSSMVLKEQGSSFGSNHGYQFPML